MKVTSSPRCQLLTAMVFWLTVGCGVSARSALELGERRWRAATGLTRSAPDGGEVDTFAPFDCGGRSSNGCWVHDPDRVTINVARTAAEVLRTGTHEWGHRLGAPDLGNGIMGDPGATPTSDCITELDVAMVCDGPRGPCLWENPECK